jgi:hypothetical protein
MITMALFGAPILTLAARRVLNLNLAVVQR